MAYIKSIGIGSKNPAYTGKSKKEEAYNRKFVPAPSGEQIQQQEANQLLAPQAGKNLAAPAPPPQYANWEIPQKPPAQMTPEELQNYQLSLATAISREGIAQDKLTQAQNIIGGTNIPPEFNAQNAYGMSSLETPTEAAQPLTEQAGTIPTPPPTGGVETLPTQETTAYRLPSNPIEQAKFEYDYYKNQFKENGILMGALSLLSPPKREGEITEEMALISPKGIFDDVAKGLSNLAKGDLSAAADDVAKAATKTGGDPSKVKAVTELNREVYKQVLDTLKKKGGSFASNMDDLSDDVIKSSSGKVDTIVNKWSVTGGTNVFNIGGKGIANEKAAALSKNFLVNFLKGKLGVKALITLGLIASASERYLYYSGMAFNKRGDALQTLSIAAKIANQLDDKQLAEEVDDMVLDLRSSREVFKNYIPVYGYFQKEMKFAEAVLLANRVYEAEGKETSGVYSPELSAEIKKYKKYLEG